MSSVHLSGVAFAYPDALPLFHDVSLDLPVGWSAIAGPNGAGKTTLMRLLAGDLRPTAGHVRLAGRAVAMVRQAPDAPTDEVRELSWRWDSAACRLRARLGLEVEQLERWPSLSGGERQRWQIAAAVACDPDVLLLDEPTNHLDAEARGELSRLLREHRGIGVVVAHDRAFLDALVERVVWVEAGLVELSSGTYTEVRARQHARQRRRAHERGVAKAEQVRLVREQEARLRRAASSQRSISARTRAKGPRDSDGRSVNRRARAEAAAEKHARAAKRMRARADRAEAPLADLRVDKARHRDLTLRGEATRRADVLRLELPALSIAGRRLLEPTLLTLERDARVRLAGPNGCGKSSLLEAVVERWPHPRDRLLYLPQREPDGRALLARIEGADPETRGRALSLCAALGLRVDALRASRAPSPGQARKLALAEGLAREVWCVILDEPTNHLDAPSIERIEAALAAYPGAVLLVTHDVALADAVTDTTWTLEMGALR